MSGLVAFIGAGPGDAELITVKGLRRLRVADVVIHDRLIARALLDEARAAAEIFDVGKAPGNHCVGQEEINRLLVEHASAGKLVVRLKGGDPSIFARLGEEIAAVRAAGLAFEVVPGVTAATAAAARTGISLTRRGGASMVVFATGTSHTGRAVPPLDWDLLARVEGTLVFYMPVRSLVAIVTRLIASGRDLHEPSLVVERVGMAGERAIASPLGAIGEVAERANVDSPALLMVGLAVGDPCVPSDVREALALAGG